VVIVNEQAGELEWTGGAGTLIAYRRRPPFAFLRDDKSKHSSSRSSSVRKPDWDEMQESR